jgi:hypothetical protein
VTREPINQIMPGYTYTCPEGATPWWVAVDSAEVVKWAVKDGLPLDQLIEAVCPGCGDVIFLDVPALVEIERVLGEPAAVCCQTCYLHGWEPTREYLDFMAWLGGLKAGQKRRN